MRWKAWSFSFLASSTETWACRWYLLSFCCQWALGGCWILLLWAWLPVDHYGVAWYCYYLSLRRQYQTRHSLAPSLEGAVNGCCLFFSLVLFLGTSAFRLPLVLSRSSLFLLQGVCYPLPLEFYPGHPSVGIFRVLSFWRTYVTSLVELKFPPSLSNAYTHRCDVRDPCGTYSICSCLFFRLEC